MSGLQKESRTDPVAGSSTMIEPSMMVQSGGYFNTDQPTVAWTGPSACSQLCRMCATENEYLIPIFEGEGVEHQLGMKIEKHLPIRVHVGDTLPLHVCYQCASTLIAWHDLVVGCIEAEKKLLQIQTHGRAEAQVEEVDVKSADSALFFPEQMDTEPSAQPSTSGAINVPTRGSPKKTVPKANPKLKMVIVKTPTAPAAASSRIVAPKTEAIPDTAESHKSEWPGLAVARPPAAKAPEKTSVCPVCGRLFSRKYDMVRHLKRHPEFEHSDHLLEQCFGGGGGGAGSSTARSSPRAREKDALCPVCGREFTRKWDMVRHLKVHPEFDRSLFERPSDDSLEQYFARKADHSFFRKAKPKPRENVPCPVCGHVFSRRYDMNRHLKVHPEYDPATAPSAPHPPVEPPRAPQMPIVSVPTPQPMAHANLMGGHEVDESRIVSADGQAYFRCRHCGQDFTQRYIFARHLRMHSERPFTCHVCGLEWPQSLLPSGRPPNSLLSCSACSLIVSSRFPSANN